MLQGPPLSSRIRGHLRNNVVGYVAVFIALSGTAYAVDGPLPGQNQVGTEDIIDGEVRQPDIQNGAVTTADISNSNGVRSEDVRDDTLAGGGLTAQDLAAGSVGTSEVAGDSLTAADLAADSVGASELGPDAVDSANVLGKSLTGEDVALGAIGPAQLQDLGVGTGDLADGAVTGPKLAALSVSSSKIFPSAVTGQKIADNAVGGSQIADNAVGGSEIADGTVSQNDVGSSAVDASELGALNERTVDFGVPEGKFASGTVSCQSGEQVISGGFDLSFPNRIKVTEFRRSGNGWRLQAFNDPGAGDLGGTSVYAYCLNPGS